MSSPGIVKCRRVLLTPLLAGRHRLHQPRHGGHRLPVRGRAGDRQARGDGRPLHAGGPGDRAAGRARAAQRHGRRPARGVQRHQENSARELQLQVYIDR